MTLDGELYVHGQPLQAIASWAKRKQERTYSLEYWIYDAIFHDEDVEYKDRMKFLIELDFAPPVILTPTAKVIGEEHMYNAFKQMKGQGYEGLILRHQRGLYNIGKRTGNLIKVKSRFDAEYKVVDMEVSKDGWAVLVCELPGGRIFKTSAPGTIAEKAHVWQYKHLFIGKYVTVEYANLTNDGKPFHAVATRWRTDI